MTKATGETDREFTAVEYQIAERPCNNLTKA